jgi:hypothetical protein
VKTSLSVLVLACSLVPLAACSSSEASVVELRQVASDARGNPTTCPYDLDVSGALDADDVKAGEVSVEVSKSTEPADDPQQAQQDGASALEAAAGTYVSCTYAVGDKTLQVHVTTAAEKAAPGLLLPLLQREAKLSVDQLKAFADDLEDAGSAKVAPGGKGALELVPVDGDGSAALMVTGDAASGDELGDVTEDLVDDLVESAS